MRIFLLFFLFVSIFIYGQDIQNKDVKTFVASLNKASLAKEDVQKQESLLIVKEGGVDTVTLSDIEYLRIFENENSLWMLKVDDIEKISKLGKKQNGRDVLKVYIKYHAVIWKTQLTLAKNLKTPGEKREKKDTPKKEATWEARVYNSSVYDIHCWTETPTPATENKNLFLVKSKQKSPEHVHVSYIKDLSGQWWKCDKGTSDINWIIVTEKGVITNVDSKSSEPK